MKSALEECTKRLSGLDSETSRKLEDARALLEALGRDRTDDNVFEDGVNATLQQRQQRRFVHDWESLSLPGQVAVARIMAKFGNVLHIWYRLDYLYT